MEIRSLRDPHTDLTSTGLTTLQELKLDVPLAFYSSENFLSRTSTLELGLHISGLFSSLLEVKAEDFSETDL